MSAFCGTVIIRAKDENEAYSVATQEFITAAEVPEGIAVPFKFREAYPHIN